MAYDLQVDLLKTWVANRNSCSNSNSNASLLSGVELSLSWFKREASLPVSSWGDPGKLFRAGRIVVSLATSYREFGVGPKAIWASVCDNWSTAIFLQGATALTVDKTLWIELAARHRLSVMPVKVVVFEPKESPAISLGFYQDLGHEWTVCEYELR